MFIIGTGVCVACAVFSWFISKKLLGYHEHLDNLGRLIFDLQKKIAFQELTIKELKGKVFNGHNHDKKARQAKAAKELQEQHKN